MAKKKSEKTGSEFENLNFEQAIGTLTQIVQQIETGQVPLQESLQQYEKGMALIAHCKGILLDAEKRIEQIEARQPSDSQTQPEEDEIEEEIEEAKFTDIESDEDEESLF